MDRKHWVLVADYRGQFELPLNGLIIAINHVMKFISSRTRIFVNFFYTCWPKIVQICLLAFSLLFISYNANAEDLIEQMRPYFGFYRGFAKKNMALPGSSEQLVTVEVSEEGIKISNSGAFTLIRWDGTKIKNFKSGSISFKDLDKIADSNFSFTLENMVFAFTHLINPAETFGMWQKRKFDGMIDDASGTIPALQIFGVHEYFQFYSPEQVALGFYNKKFKSIAQDRAKYARWTERQLSEFMAQLHQSGKTSDCSLIFE